MIDIELDEEMEMPCPCDVCGGWFDLNDGHESPFKKGVIICHSCYEMEHRQKELENLIAELQLDLDNKEEYTIGNRWEFKRELKEMKNELAEIKTNKYK